MRILAICVLLNANIVSAQTRLLPEYVPCTWQGERYACYDFEAQKKLNLLEVETQSLRLKLDAQLVIASTAQKEVTNLEKQLAATLDNEKVCRTFLKTNTDALLKSIEEKNKWRAEAETPTIWPYLVGGSLGLVGLSVGLGVFLGSLR